MLSGDEIWERERPCTLCGRISTDQKWHLSKYRGFIELSGLVCSLCMTRVQKATQKELIEEIIVPMRVAAKLLS